VPACVNPPGDQYLAAAETERKQARRVPRAGYTLATETVPGSLLFTTVQLTTALSDPTQGDRWFSGRTPNSSFPHPTTFLGDYSGIGSDLSGGAVGLWTDMRNTVCFGVRCGAGEDAFFGHS
jgi:hypothetical protein